MNQQPSEPPAKEVSHLNHDFFDVYKVAINDIHRTKDLGQRIDSFYLTLITLLFTADAYEIATSKKFDNWLPCLATAGVALIGLAVTGRWRQGANNLFKITTNRYVWLRDAEKHPEMEEIGANIFTQEHKEVYEPQAKARSEITVFYRRTVFLQFLCLLTFPAVPVFLAIGTFLTLNPQFLQVVERMISGR